MPKTKHLSFEAPPGWPLTRLAIDVLAWREGAEWTAVALDMDLQAYGSTVDEALKDLDELVAMQIGFAIQKKQPGLILKPAPPHLWEILARERALAVKRLVENDPSESDYVVGSLPMSAELMAYAKRKGKSFERVYAR